MEKIVVESKMNSFNVEHNGFINFDFFQIPDNNFDFSISKICLVYKYDALEKENVFQLLNYYRLHERTSRIEPLNLKLRCHPKSTFSFTGLKDGEELHIGFSLS